MADSPVARALVAAIKWDAQGLVAAVAQDRLSGRVQMVAWMNEEALAVTLRTRRATFFSRSCGALWTKGESSGHHLAVDEVALDCDGDTVLLLVDPVGPSCHTGAETCFFRAMEADADDVARAVVRERASVAAPLIEALEREIEARRSVDAAKSYTRTLLDGGGAKIGEKLREEADELARAVEAEPDARVVAEGADVVFHLLVALACRGVRFRDVLAELGRRRGVSGHAEKAARPRG